MNEVILGTSEAGSVMLNINRLVESRLLLQANSGGGKSWTIRRLLEQTYGHVQQLVIDPEDEFHTLREEFDYVLAGRDGGDCPAEPKSARLLAQRFLELEVNGIFGIFELKAHERIRFVRLFLEGLIDAPRKLWRPVLVIVDEAHMFCPEKGKAESGPAVIDLMTRGRKRGFCGVLATQRISKLAKDAAAEANNLLIGRAALDIDMKRAADALGLSTRVDRDQLRHLKPGQFFCFGPALTETVTLMKVGAVETEHPKSGVASAPPKPAPARLKEILGKLADVPDDHQKAETIVDDLRTELRLVQGELRVEKRKKRTVAPAAQDEKEFERGRKQGEAGSGNEIADLRRRLGKISTISTLDDAIPKPAVGRYTAYSTKKADRPKPDNPTSDQPIGGGQRRMIDVLVSRHPAKFTKTQWGTLAKLKHSGSTFSTYLSRLRQQHLIEEGGGLFWASEFAMAEFAADAPTLGTAEEIRAHWIRAVGENAAGRLLSALIGRYDIPISKEQLAEQCGLTPSGSTFSTYFSRLRSNKLIVEKPEGIMAAEILFEEAGH